MGRAYRAPSESSQKLYRATLKRAFGDAEPSFVPRLESSNHSWPESTRVTLRAALQWYWARRDKKRGESLAESIDVGRNIKRQKAWPNEQESRAFEKVLAKAPDKPRVVIQVGLGLGLRSEELLSMPRANLVAALRWGRLTVPGKGSKERVLSVAGVHGAIETMLKLKGQLPHARERAEEYGEEPAWETPGQLLSSPDSSLQTQRNMLSRHIKAIAKSAGLNPNVWTPHTLRHLFATRMHHDGASPAVIRVAMGHEDISTTMTYLHIEPEDVAKYMRKVKP